MSTLVNNYLKRDKKNSFLLGMGNAVDVWGVNSKPYPREKDSIDSMIDDFESIKLDNKRIGDDIRKTMLTYGE